MSEITTMTRAIEAFAQGVAFTRSFTHPYLAEQVGPLWVLRDAPRKRNHYRTEEWIAHDIAAAEVDQIARAQTRGRFSICALCSLDEPQTPLRADYKALGYRLVTTEPMMVHLLTEIPHVDAPAVIVRVMAPALAERLAKAARARQMLPDHLAPNAPLRQYVALIEEELVGWARSIVVGDATWCSDMYVKPAFRRRGIARALLSRMLHDDRASGAKLSVLLASHTGAKLYPVVGYRQVGELLIFTLKK